jgi:hypothetical protein
LCTFGRAEAVAELLHEALRLLFLMRGSNRESSVRPRNELRGKGVWMRANPLTFSMRERRCFITRLNMSESTLSAAERRLSTSGMML